MSKPMSTLYENDDNNLSDEVARVAKAEQQMRQNVDDVGFEHATQHQTEHLERKQSACGNGNENGMKD